jgi:hypothetical protein
VGGRCQDRAHVQYSQAEKEQFHAVLDRTGSIVATAREFWLNIGTARTRVGRPHPAGRKPRAARTVRADPGNAIQRR